MIQRFFYPVGQGAFYSEKHKGYNIVYDCGTEWKNRANKEIDKVITQSFSKEDEIDILFISHFDYDHVSKIENLKKHVTTIKKVVMPLLHKNEKILLTNIYQALEPGISTLVSNPQKFFGEKTTIITISPTDGEKSINDNVEHIDIDKIETSEIPSGSVLEKGFDNYKWVYIPYNYMYSSRNKQLEELFEENKIDKNKIRNDVNYILNKITENRKIIKDIYGKLRGNINQNSMILYSGIYLDSKLYKTSKSFQYIRGHYIPTIGSRYCYSRVSCIYTGDANLNLIDLSQVFQKYWHYVGTVQIPHHGDVKSFNTNFFSNRYYCCPISVGKNNSYGHPSCQVIADIMSKGSRPILVTENLHSGYVECIK